MTLDVCVMFRKNILMPMSAEEITRRIQTALPDAILTLEDLAGDNDHWKLVVESAAFVGKTRVQQHQMVYAAFGKDMGTTLHALALETRSPKP